MDSKNPQPTRVCHVVAMPFPGRGHINPMMNLCKLLSSKKKDIIISFVVTEEWLGYIDSEPKPENIRFEAIPNVIPPERLKAADFPGFYEAVMTKMEAPFEQLLDRLELPVTAIIGDIEVRWSTGVGNRRNIPVALVWTMSASVFSMFHHFDVHIKHCHGKVDLIEQVEEIPGISSSNVAELRTIFKRDDQRVLELALDCISRVSKAQYLLFTSVYEYEPQVFDRLRAIYNFPVFPIGPAIPYLELKDGSCDKTSNYVHWLDSQQEGLQMSGVRFLWVARGEASRLNDCCGDLGLVIPCMNSIVSEPNVSHIVAMPYPGRGHINPLMNLCKVLVSKSDNILVTFVVTEEWLGFIDSEPKHDKISLCYIPNVVPSELVRASNMVAFLEAVWTKMEAPFEQLLDELDPPVTLIMADTHLFWTVSVGNRKKIPVASFWPMSVSMFSVFHHFHLFQANGHFPVDLLDNKNERVDYIPGVSSTRLLDIPGFNGGIYPVIMKEILCCISSVQKSQYLLFPSIYELESQSIDALKQEFSIPIYPVGPAIPYIKPGDKSCSSPKSGFLQWLDRQPRNSVLYVSLGSFLSVSSAQMDEIAAALQDSGVRFLLVAREEASRLKDCCGDHKGLVVPWCDQMKVLCHRSIGGFWSHCGWNSVREGVFAGIPFLTFPLFADQNLNSKIIVEDWKIGWRVNFKSENLVTREEISKLVQKFMDLENDEGKEMRQRAKELQEKCLHAMERNGSSETNINSFIQNMSHFNGH
ncbi:UDP-glucuronosyl/UDP-glucosyltransferase [Corchorus capsularis]|uniref:UDP-glucuronosyl/UDP-glucosyltransferase n=1 Tax=Corchorus capsularis TaxID=210143 RepID=A0A1R3IK01_COCAP|nr:UDP-glucuronosyl/UDP-glucosyltransferase [Corchorus capsularis]